MKLAKNETAVPNNPESSDPTEVRAPASVPVRSAPVPASQVRTKERDPADRLAWKRERAKALGQERH